MSRNGRFQFSRAEVVSSMSLQDGCYYCGGQADTWDHVVPRTRGGIGTIDNLVPCCRSCNSSKGHKTLYEFRVHLRKQGRKDEFDTPEPFEVHGTLFYNGLGRADRERVLFVGENGLIITNWDDFGSRIYVNEK